MPEDTRSGTGSVAFPPHRGENGAATLTLVKDKGRSATAGDSASDARYPALRQP